MTIQAEIIHDLKAEINEWQKRYYKCRSAKNCYKNGYKHEKKEREKTEHKFDLIMETLR